MHVRSLFLASALSLFLNLPVGSVLRAEVVSADHPAGPFVKKYLENVVKQDWNAASAMLLPSSLDRKKAQMIDIVKNSRTMTEEGAKLRLLGVKDVREIEKMTVQEAYIADRKAVHDMDERMKISPEVLKRKIETLNITILGLVPEDDGKIMHTVVRTRQETLDASIEELLLISVVQDKSDSKKWFVAPDMQVPITLPLKTEETAKKEEAPKKTESSKKGAK